MTPTLNSAINRIETICLAHRQIRSFYQGSQGEWINDKKTKYPSALLLYNVGAISPATKTQSIAFTILLGDLQNVSFRTDENLLDVQSDMLSVCADLITQFSDPRFDDWTISGENGTELFSGSEGDYLAGASVSFTVFLQYSMNLCQVPSDMRGDVPIEAENVEAFDLKYVAAGTEGSTIVVANVDLGKVLLITRENAILYQVSNNPDEAEYSVSGNSITLGTPLTKGERFLILYRAS